jgi:hypothetical protein
MADCIQRILSYRIVTAFGVNGWKTKPGFPEAVTQVFSMSLIVTSLILYPVLCCFWASRRLSLAPCDCEQPGPWSLGWEANRRAIQIIIIITDIIVRMTARVVTRNTSPVMLFFLRCTDSCSEVIHEGSPSSCRVESAWLVTWRFAATRPTDVTPEVAPHRPT